MNTDEREDIRTYKVVINHEDQYSIWPAERPNPPGWRDGGKTGKKKDCLAYIQSGRIYGRVRYGKRWMA
jgi:MbtH protein